MSSAELEQRTQKIYMSLGLSNNPGHWINKRPTQKGYYWIKHKNQSDSKRIVNVWISQISDLFFTNDDGGCRVDDAKYDNMLWWSVPILEPGD